MNLQREIPEDFKRGGVYDSDHEKRNQKLSEKTLVLAGNGDGNLCDDSFLGDAVPHDLLFVPEHVGWDRRQLYFMDHDIFRGGGKVSWEMESIFLHI